MADKETTIDKVDKVFTKGCGMYSFVTRLILFLCFCSILGCIGTLIYNSSADYKGKTTAHINYAKCNTNIVHEGSRTKTKYDCDLNLSYNVNNIDYSGNLSTSSDKYYANNTKVNINYDLNNPKLFQIKEKISSKTISIILIVIAGLCLISSIVHVALYFTSEWYEHSLCADLLSSRTYNSYDYGYRRPSLISIF